MTPLADAIAAPAAVEADAARRSDVLRRLEEQREAVRREETLRRFQKRGAQIDKREAPAATPEGGQCITLEAIAFTGATILGEQDQAKISKPFLNRCIRLREVDEILRAVTNFYIERGYVTTRALVPEQDLNDGSLEIFVLEGRIGGMRKGEPASDTYALGTAFPGLDGAILNLRVLEQGLDQINRLRSNNATLDMQPGERPGETVVVIQEQPSKRWHTGLSFDNSGSESTGENQMEGSLTLDNLLSLNDELSFSYRANTNHASKRKATDNYSAGLSVPYGAWLAQGRVSYSTYDSRIETPAQSFLSSGRTFTTSLNLDWVFYRDQVSRLIATGSLTYQDTNNFIDRVRLGVSSRSSTVAILGLRASTFIGKLSLSGDVAYARGLRLFGATARIGSGPEPFFDRFAGGIEAATTIPIPGGPLSVGLRSSLRAQYAVQPVFGKDEISISGRYATRGFDDAVVSGAVGGYWRNDLTLNHAPTVLFSSLAAFTFFDAGRVAASKGATGGKVYGTGFGVRGSNRWLQFDVTYARPLNGISSIKSAATSQLYLRVAVNY